MLASKQRVIPLMAGNIACQHIMEESSTKGDIVLKNVDFSYDDGKKALRNISITIPRQKTTVIWGRSGSGKSTLAKLILGLYTPESGSIEFVDKGVSTDVTCCNKQMSLLEQQPFIFEGSVQDNILLGDLEANESDMRRAGSVACIAARIEQLPHGYETILDEKVPLSRGEKQRLALARCLVRNTEVIILDEPTSALNAEMACEVLQSVQKYYPEATKIIITHDPSLLDFADHRVTIEQGRVVSAELI